MEIKNKSTITFKIDELSNIIIKMVNELLLSRDINDIDLENNQKYREISNKVLNENGINNDNVDCVDIEFDNPTQCKLILDKLLDKISNEGIDKLNCREVEFLNKYNN